MCCWGDAGMMRCMGVHMACMTSGGTLSKRIMVEAEGGGGEMSRKRAVYIIVQDAGSGRRLNGCHMAKHCLLRRAPGLRGACADSEQIGSSLARTDPRRHIPAPLSPAVWPAHKLYETVCAI